MSGRAFLFTNALCCDHCGVEWALCPACTAGEENLANRVYCNGRPTVVARKLREAKESKDE